FVLPITLVFSLGRAEVPPPAGWDLAFQDDFSRTSIGMDWTILRGDWHLKDGRLHITREWSSDSIIRTSAPHRENVRLEFDVETPGTHTVSAAVRIGDQQWDGGGSMRAGRGSNPKRGGRSGGLLTLAPKASKEPDSDFLELEAGKTYHVVLQFEDGQLKGWVDGKLAKDEPADLSGGFNDYISLFTTKDASFDNVLLYTKPFGKSYAPIAPTTPETNRRATVDASKFFDPAKPDCGLQTAIDALPAGGGAVILPKGEFVLHRPLFLREGVTIRGQGAETKLMLPSPIVWSKIAAPAVVGDTTVTLEDASKFSPDWMLSLGDAEMYYLRATPPWYVKSVQGNTITLSQPLDRALPKGALVGNWFPVFHTANSSNIEIRDLDIIGRGDDPAPFLGSYGTSGVTFFFTREVRVDNVNIHGWKGDAFSFQGGRENLLTASQALQPHEKGFHPGSCQQRMIISRCLADGSGDDAFFFCRYNQLSAMSNNTYLNSKAAMIGGLAKAGDMFNTINRNLGKNNKLGMSMGEGANDVMVDNVAINTGTLPVIEFLGGTYEGPPHLSHSYAGPARYHVVAGNVFVQQSPAPTEGAFITVKDGAGANVITNNQGLEPGQIVLENPTDNMVADNQKTITLPETPPRPPAAEALPPLAVDAAKFYDPSLPDCGFQKALDQAREKGGTVRLPAGVYPLSTGLVVPSGVTLCGEGIATRLVWSGSGAAITSKDTSNIGIRRLAITAEKGDAIGIILDKVQGALIEGVNLTDCAVAGLRAEGGNGLLITGCRARHCGTGYDLQNVAMADVVESWALENNQDGLRLTGGANVDSCVIWFNKRNGIRADGAGTGKFTLMSSVVSASGEEGVFITDAPGATVRGSVIHNSSLNQIGKFAAVSLRGTTKDARVVENRIGDEIYDATPRIGVRESDGAANNIVRFNAIGPSEVPPEKRTERLVVAEGKETSPPANSFAPFFRAQKSTPR
ncbi:MAG: right-handed parallel beta-helix repeat-containing protein, partial [Verrucomicrobiota bacterium]